jgi:MATE family multidrug resistance protein
MARSTLREMVALSAPLAAGHAGNQLMSLVDTAMVAPLGAPSLAGVGIGNGIYFASTLVGMGCVLGMEPLVTQALGAGEAAGARRIYWQGLRVGVYVGVPITILVGLLPLLLPLVRVEPAVAFEARSFVWGRLANVIPFLLFAAGRAYLQATHLTRPIVIAMIVANVANFVGNAIFIYGDRSLAWIGLDGIGLPALGVAGSGIASALASLLSFVVLVYAIKGVAVPKDPSRRAHDGRLVRRIFGLGLPVGLQLLAEVGAFASAGVMAGTMSANAGAGHQIAITLASFTFTVTIGIMAATTVLVGRAIGRGDTAGARRAGLTGLALGAGFMCFAALCFVLFRWQLARALADSDEVVRAAVPLLAIAAVFQISDGLQAIGSGALRGAGDVRTGLVANLVGHYGVGLPLAVTLGFLLDMGAPGLWWGLSAGLTTVAIWLVVRFLRISSKPIARV